MLALGDYSENSRPEFMNVESATVGEHHTVIIVGAGPGGLQLGQSLGCAGIDYVILERDEIAGSFFKKYPTNRRLLSINKIHTGFEEPAKNLRWDWNSLISNGRCEAFRSYDDSFFPGADNLVRYLGDFCRYLELDVRFGFNVDDVAKSKERFRITSENGTTMTCQILVIATGTSINHRPEVPGIELAEQYGTHDDNLESYTNKNVLIIGKGNSAFETAEEILPYAARIHLISPNPLTMAWQSHFPGHLRQVNSTFLETFLLKQQNAVLNGHLQSIKHQGMGYVVDVKWTENGHPARLSYDRVIACTGFSFDSTPFDDSMRPELAHDDRLPRLTYQWESTNVPNLFFCGSVMQSNDFKKAASPFIHGIRYNAQVLSRFIRTRLGDLGLDLFETRMPLDMDVVFDRLYSRLLESSSLWHMHSTLCDAIVLEEGSTEVTYLEDVPIGMLSEEPSLKNKPRIEFQFTFKNPTDPAERAKYTPVGLLHPMLRFIHCGRIVGECHMYEDIYADWADRDEWGPRFRRAMVEFIVETSV